MTILTATELSANVRENLPVATIADLKELAAPDNQAFQEVQGYYAAGDGGGGSFWWDKDSTSTDNGGTVITPDSAPASGRWRALDVVTINIRQFGANPSQTGAINTAAVVAALGAATASTAEVFAPAGTYAMSTAGSFPLSVPAGITFRGAGREQTIFDIDAALNPAAIVRLGSRASIEDIQLDYTGNASDGVDTPTTVTDIAIRRNKFVATLSGFPIQLNSANRFWVEDNYIDNQGATASAGIDIQTSNRGLVAGNVVHQLQQLGGPSAIRSNGGNHIRIEANHVIGGNILHYGGGTHGTLIGNIIETANGDSGFGATWPDLFKHFTCEGNTCTGSTDYCYSFTACQYGAIVGNTARNASTGGFGMLDCKYVTVMGNTALNNGQQNFVAGGDTVRNGFLFNESAGGRCRNNICIGNVALDDQGTATQKQGINMTGSASNSIVALNHAFNNGLSQIVTTASDITFGNKTAESTNTDFSGTWTPGVAFGGNSVGVTYGEQTGTWTRVGNLITVRARITLTNKGSSTGAATITGLPFSGASSLVSSMSVAYAAAFAAGITNISGYASSTTIQLQTFGAGSTANIQETSFNNTSDLIFSMQYESANP